MGNPSKVTYQTLSATVRFYPSDGLYHAYWNTGGHKGKVAAKSKKEVERKAKERLRLIHQGKNFLPNLTKREAVAIAAGIDALQRAGYPELLTVVTEYIEAKKALRGMDLTEVARSHVNQHLNVEPVPFVDAARDWFETRQGRWAKITRDNHERRMRLLTTTFEGFFTAGPRGLNFECVRVLFNESLVKKSAKWRNHVRDTLRQIVAHCVSRRWMPKDHGLESLLQNEKHVPAPPEITDAKTYLLALEAADAELLPITVLMGFCGIRRAEALRMRWEDVWELDDCIVVNAQNAKTSTRRTVPRFAAVTAWLAPYRRSTGPIWRKSEWAFNHAFEQLRKTTGLSGKHNVLRHSFASYRYALTDSADKTAKELGNSPAIMLNSYYQLATATQGAAWFAIMPTNKNNIIQAA